MFTFIIKSTSSESSVVYANFHHVCFSILQLAFELFKLKSNENWKLFFAHFPFKYQKRCTLFCHHQSSLEFSSIWLFFFDVALIFSLSLSLQKKIWKGKMILDNRYYLLLLHFRYLGFNFPFIPKICFLKLVTRAFRRAQCWKLWWVYYIIENILCEVNHSFFFFEKIPKLHIPWNRQRLSI